MDSIENRLRSPHRTQPTPLDSNLTHPTTTPSPHPVPTTTTTPTPTTAAPTSAQKDHFTRSGGVRKPAMSPGREQDQLPVPSQHALRSTAPSLPTLAGKEQGESTPIVVSTQVPPTPESTSPSEGPLPLPSFITNSPQSSDFEDSDTSGMESASDDEGGVHRPPRTETFSRRTGLRRIRPSYYFDANYDPASATTVKKRGRRGGLKGVPVFEPTMKEFEEEGGFYGFVKRIEKYGMRSGVVKVIPPKEWSDSLPSTAGPLVSIRLREPIEQHMVGSQGLYRVTNVAKSRIWNTAQWKEMAEMDKWASPDFLASKKQADRSERSTRGTGVRVKTAAMKGKASATPEAEVDPGAEADGEQDGDVVMEMGGEASTFKTTMRTRTPTDSLPDSHDTTMNETPRPDLAPQPHTPTSLAAESPLPHHPISEPSQTRATSAAAAAASAAKPKKKRPTNMQRAEPTLEEWHTFLDTFEELPHGAKKEDYTIEMLREVERRYWRTLTFGESPMYGADMKGSLFDHSTTAWNVAKLGDLLPKLVPASCKIPGVVSPYLYFGMWRATFAWHVEDADLYSINYIHFGAPKFWYSVPQEMSDRFERVMEGLFPTDRVKCAQFLRHKSFLASPRVLANAGITLNRCVQLPGEFILTYPKGYHSGFNLGFNCAESINFATERWLPLGRTAKACVCIGDSVNIDVDRWLADASRAEYGDKMPKNHTSASTPVPSSLPKRKHTAVAIPAALDSESARKKKAIKLEDTPADTPAPGVVKAKKELEVIVEKTDSFVCALCPDMALEGLVPIGEAGVKSRKGLSAHKVCVMFTPATWIEIDPVTAQEMVRGYSRIEKARWKLKCQLCSEKHGTKVQCTKGKCPKAAHVTCALREGSGVFLDATIVEAGGTAVSVLDQARAEVEADKDGVAVASTSKVAIPHRSSPPPLQTASTVAPPVMGDDGAVQQPVIAAEEPVVDGGGIKLTILCRTHNPAYRLLENGRKTAALGERVAALPVDSRILVKASGGTFDVTLVLNVPAKEAVSVLFDDGKRSEIRWKNIVWPEMVELKNKKEEAAAKARQESIWVSDVRPLQPTKRIIAGSVPPPPVVPQAPASYLPYQFHPPPQPTSSQQGQQSHPQRELQYQPYASTSQSQGHFQPSQAAPHPLAGLGHRKIPDATPYCVPPPAFGYGYIPPHVYARQHPWNQEASFQNPFERYGKSEGPSQGGSSSAQPQNNLTPPASSSESTRPFRPLPASQSNSHSSTSSSSTHDPERSLPRLSTLNLPQRDPNSYMNSSLMGLAVASQMELSSYSVSGNGPALTVRADSNSRPTHS